MMIDKVTNFTHKSFKNYTGPDIPFKRHNVLFGYNGKGKTSLAKGIIDEFLKTDSIENLRHYDHDYILSNLSIDDTTIKGVKADFGKENVNIEKQIKALNSTIKDTTNDIKKKAQIEQEILKRISSIFYEHKGSLKIQKKQYSQGIDFIISAYDNDYKEAHKIEPNDSVLADMKGDNSLQIEYENLLTYQIPVVNLSFCDEEFKRSLELFGQALSGESIPSLEIIKWIEQGIHLHKSGNKCLFCGNQSLDFESIKMSLNEYHKNKKQQAMAQLSKYRDCFEKLNGDIEYLQNCATTVIQYLGEESKAEVELIVAQHAYFKGILTLYNHKLSSFEKPLSVDIDNLINEIEKVQSACDKLLGIKSNKLKKMSEKLSKLDKLVKGSIAINIKNDPLIVNELEELKSVIDEINIKNSDNERIIEKIKTLRLQKTTTGDFAQFVSNILIELEIGFRLDLEGDDYVLKSIRENSRLKITDISEGEKNLLSLLFFFYELFEDKEQKVFKSSINMIIIDDPIYSVDDINKMFILSLIDRILKLETQVFVFTHLWEDFNDLIYPNDENRNSYEIFKDGNSNLRISNKRATPYRHDFLEVFVFSKKRLYDSVDDTDLYHMPNTIRRVLEQYLAFKLATKPIPTTSNESSVKIALFGNVNNISSNSQRRLSVLLKLCNANSHKTARNPQELIDSAKFLMERIRAMDIVHYNSMKENL